MKLVNGVEIPTIGYGTWKLKNEESTTSCLLTALQCGYRLIDTAFAYNNEEAIGQAIYKCGIDRKELFISGKLWNDDRGFDNVVSACQRTIDNLQCEYLDLYLIHWPASRAVHDNWQEINAETWKAMEYLYEKGYVKAIGVCNFKVNQLQELFKTAKIKPMVNQIEYHPGFPQEDIVNFCQKHSIIVEGWSPLGSGKMLKKEVLQELAQKYHKSVAQLCIRWCIQNEVIPLPKSKDETRMLENLQINDFTISEEDMNIINHLPYMGGSGLDSETLTLFG